MKTFISELIPRLVRFSKRLDNLTLLINQHWVVIDELQNNKNVYIFRSNSDLLISQNGIVEKAKWEYLGNDSLLIDTKDGSYLFKQGFFDENVLALKLDSRNEYAFLINDRIFNGDLNSYDKVTDFLENKYINNPILIGERILEEEEKVYYMIYETDKGRLEIEQKNSVTYPNIGMKAFIDGLPAQSGKYKFGFMWHVHIENGRVSKLTLL